MPKLTKKGAQSVTEQFDRMATLLEQEHETLGIEAHIASDMSYRFDLLSDAIDRQAGVERTALDELDVVKEDGFDPEEIGEEKGGPLEDEPDEPYMNGEFTQQENRELREKVQDGDLSADSTSPEPQAPRPGVQSSLSELVKAASGSNNPHVARAIALALDVAKTAKKAEEDGEDEPEEKTARKRASHGFNLNA